MCTDRRKWRDPRTGRKWSVDGYWAPGEALMGQVVLTSGDESIEIWHVSNRGVLGLTDREIQKIVDGVARRGVQPGSRLP